MARRRRERELDAFEIELLCLILQVQEALERGEWESAWTVYSRTAFLAGKRHGALVPSPVANKWNLERAFKLRFERVTKRLKQRGFLRSRGGRRRGGETPAHKLGYARHQDKSQDLLLTSLGRQTAELLAQQHGPGESAGPSSATGARLVYEAPPDGGSDYGYTLSLHPPGTKKPPRR